VLNKKLTVYSGCVVVETVRPHGYEFMATVELTLSDAQPANLNGLKSCFITGPTTYRFETMETFSSVLDYGRTDYNINLVQNYMSESTVVFRENTQNYEINP
jgi:hypothetical protein